MGVRFEALATSSVRLDESALARRSFRAQPAELGGEECDQSGAGRSRDQGPAGSVLAPAPVVQYRQSRIEDDCARH